MPYARTGETPCIQRLSFGAAIAPHVEYANGTGGNSEWDT